MEEQQQQKQRKNQSKPSGNLTWKSVSQVQMKPYILILRFGSLMQASKEDGAMKLAANAKKVQNPTQDVLTVALTMKP